MEETKDLATGVARKVSGPATASGVGDAAAMVASSRMAAMAMYVQTQLAKAPHIGDAAMQASVYPHLSTHTQLPSCLS